MRLINFGLYTPRYINGYAGKILQEFPGGYELLLYGQQSPVIVLKKCMQDIKIVEVAK